MKCRYCNGEIGLEQKFCPYCGRPNEESQRHSRDMERFSSRYSETEATVISKADRYARAVPRAILIILLLIASVVMYFVSENTYQIPENTRRRAAEKDPAAMCAVLDGYLEEGDYIAFASCFSFNGLRTYNSPFENYSDIYWCADNYKTFVLDVEKLYLHGNRENWLKYSASDDIRYLCQTLESFIETYERGKRDAEDPQHIVYLDDMRDNIMDMLHVYFGIDESEAESFLAMTDNRKASYMEEVLLDAQD